MVVKGKPLSKLKYMRDTSEKEAEEKTEQKQREELKEAKQKMADEDRGAGERDEVPERGGNDGVEESPARGGPGVTGGGVASGEGRERSGSLTLTKRNGQRPCRDCHRFCDRCHCFCDSRFCRVSHGFSVCVLSSRAHDAAGFLVWGSTPMLVGTVRRLLQQ